MEVYGYVYLARNKVNGKVYVGQTTQSVARRFRVHLSLARTGKGDKFHNAIRKYGEAAFECVELHRAFSEVELNEMEIKAIWTHSATERPYGYNLTLGGEGCRATEETRAKMSANSAIKGKHHSEQTRARLRRSAALTPAHLKTRVISEEQRRAISENNKGYKHTPETRAQMSASRTGSTRSEEAKEKTAAKHRGAKRSEQARLNMSLGKKRKREERRLAALAALREERTNEERDSCVA